MAGNHLDAGSLADRIRTFLLNEQFHLAKMAVRGKIAFTELLSNVIGRFEDSDPSILEKILREILPTLKFDRESRAAAGHSKNRQAPKADDVIDASCEVVGIHRADFSRVSSKPSYRLARFVAIQTLFETSEKGVEECFKALGIRFVAVIKDYQKFCDDLKTDEHHQSLVRQTKALLGLEAR